MKKNNANFTNRIIDLELLTFALEEQDLRVVVDSSMKASDKCMGVVQNQIEMQGLLGKWQKTKHRGITVWL